MVKKKSSGSRRHLPQGLEILYEDKDILVVDKPAGMLSVATETNKTRTAYWFLMDYVRKGNLKSRNRIFIVHRLDQWTSGVLLFAKSEEVKFRLQAGWKDTQKKYVGDGSWPTCKERRSHYLILGRESGVCSLFHDRCHKRQTRTHRV